MCKISIRWCINDKHDNNNAAITADFIGAAIVVVDDFVVSDDVIDDFVVDDAVVASIEFIYLSFILDVLFISIQWW